MTKLHKTEYLYKSIVKRVIDGDTAVFDMEKESDMGFKVFQTATFKDRHFRFKGVYALEKTLHFDQTEDEKKLGLKAKEIVKKYLKEGNEITIYTYKNRLDKYGRYVAEIYTKELGEKSLNDHLLEKYGAPMFLTYEQHIEMLENRKEKKL